jgi:CheY-like chemotaxis protein
VERGLPGLACVKEAGVDSDWTGEEKAMAHGGVGTVLVVDDTEDNLVITARFLEEAGICCLRATRGWQCLEVAKRDSVDLILLDIIMPRMDGWTTLAALRKDPATQQIPVIMFTCDDRFATRQRAMVEGAVDFLPRPVVRERLLECVQTHLNAVAHARAIEAVGRELETTLARVQDGTWNDSRSSTS